MEVTLCYNFVEWSVMKDIRTKTFEYIAKLLLLQANEENWYDSSHIIYEGNQNEEQLIFPSEEECLKKLNVSYQLKEKQKNLNEKKIQLVEDDIQRELLYASNDLEDENYNQLKSQLKEQSAMFSRMSKYLDEKLFVLRACIYDEKNNRFMPLVTSKISIKDDESSIFMQIDDEYQLVMPTLAKFNLDLTNDCENFDKLISEANRFFTGTEFTVMTPKFLVCFEQFKNDPIIVDYEQLISNRIDSEYSLFENVENLSEVTNFIFPYKIDKNQFELIKYLNQRDILLTGVAGSGKTQTAINALSQTVLNGKNGLIVSEECSVLDVFEKSLPSSLKAMTMTFDIEKAGVRARLKKNIHVVIEYLENHPAKYSPKKLEFLENTKQQLLVEKKQLEKRQLFALNQKLENQLILGKVESVECFARMISNQSNLIDDCRTEYIDLTYDDIDLISGITKAELDRNVKPCTLSSLLTTEQFTQIENIMIGNNSYTYEDLSLLTITENKILVNSEPFADQFVKWMDNPDILNLDLLLVKELVDYEQECETNNRAILRYDIFVPKNIDLLEIEELLFHLEENYLPLPVLKMKFRKFNKVIINNIPFWNHIEGEKVLKQYLHAGLAGEECERIKNYFYQSTNQHADSKELKEIISYYQEMCNNMEDMLILGLDLKTQSVKNLCKEYENVRRTFKSACQFANLIHEAKNELSKNDDLRIKLNVIDKRLKNKETVTTEYEQFYEAVKIRKEQQERKLVIDELKNRVDSHSPTLFYKLMSENIGHQVIDNWRSSFILTKLRSLDTNDYISDIVEVDEKIENLNRLILEQAAWIELRRRATPSHLTALHNWLVLNNKMGYDSKQNVELIKEAKIQLEKVIDLYPIWLCQTKNVVENFIPYSFDLLIYEEATHSLITRLNILERGKRKLVIGDEKQICTSPSKVKESYRWLRNNMFHGSQYGFIDADTTLFDYLSVVCKSIKLRENYRSMPSISNYGKQFVYEGDVLSRNIELPTANTLEAHFCSNAVYENNINKDEARKIVDIICNNYIGGSTSIGIITLLGREQAKYIEQLLIEQIGMFIYNQLNIKIGTAFEFQGDEYDVVILSMVITSKNTNIRYNPLTSEKDHKRINVAMSRARKKVILVHSIAAAQINNAKCVRYQLLEYFKASGKMINEDEIIIDSSKFEGVGKHIEKVRDVTVKIADQEALIVQGKRKTLAIINVDIMNNPRECMKKQIVAEMTLSKYNISIMRLYNYQYLIDKDLIVKRIDKIIN